MFIRVSCDYAFFMVVTQWRTDEAHFQFRYVKSLQILIDMHVRVTSIWWHRVSHFRKSRQIESVEQHWRFRDNESNEMQQHKSRRRTLLWVLW